MIFHKKGNGILLQLIKQYLAKVDVVKSSRNEYIELGG
jgi:dsDNA-specific endonuclease/ATPase MutS2